MNYVAFHPHVGIMTKISKINVIRAKSRLQEFGLVCCNSILNFLCNVEMTDIGSTNAHPYAESSDLQGRRVMSHDRYVLCRTFGRTLFDMTQTEVMHLIMLPFEAVSLVYMVCRRSLSPFQAKYSSADSICD